MVIKPVSTMVSFRSKKTSAPRLKFLSSTKAIIRIARTETIYDACVAYASMARDSKFEKKIHVIRPQD